MIKNREENCWILSPNITQVVRVTIDCPHCLRELNSLNIFVFQRRSEKGTKQPIVAARYWAMKKLSSEFKRPTDYPK